MARRKLAAARLRNKKASTRRQTDLLAQYDLRRTSLFYPAATAAEITAKASQFQISRRVIMAAAIMHGLRTLSASHITAYQARYPDLCHPQSYARSLVGQRRWNKGAANELRQSPTPTHEQTDQPAPAA